MPPVPPIPLYLDWHFWSALIALLALVLDQIPPLRVLLRDARLDVEAFSTFALSHEFGNPRVQLHLIFTNVGGRDIRVRAIRFEIQRGEANAIIIPAAGYFQRPGDKDPVLLAPFRLKPNAEWAHIVNMLVRPDREDDKNIRAWSSTLREDIRRKRQLPEN